MSIVNSHGASGKSYTVRPAPSMACISPARDPVARRRVGLRDRESGLGRGARADRSPAPVPAPIPDNRVLPGRATLAVGRFIADDSTAARRGEATDGP